MKDFLKYTLASMLGLLLFTVVATILGIISIAGMVASSNLGHAHYDHIYGLPRLAELFPEAPIYTNAAGRQALADPRANMSKYHDDPIVFTSDRVEVFDEGARIALFDSVAANVYATPGHHPSCLTFEVDGYLFTGDAYIPGIAVVTTLPGGDKALAAASRERIVTLAAGRALCPGHEVAGLPEGIVLPGSSLR